MKSNILLFILVLATGLISCKDDWDEHYSGGQTGTTEGSPEKLGDFLSLQAKYSAFTGFLQESGVLDTLNANQILTVWAVNNENMPTPGRTPAVECQREKTDRLEYAELHADLLSEI